ncbi:hypothetical protein TWF102_005195 [Orbilia oligospora]|uniref:Uncharacterized protein n=1 Tax=Orbilia oligospora TaxID=2813651 RepID=A0A7C8JBN8_ORBOL|nr:hypothetical protein TWF103_000808 [Orbilia oligospora]KAF3100309.1 hypothetical protein TWF102_005195 [Orbilia oligospora]
MHLHEDSSPWRSVAKGRGGYSIVSRGVKFKTSGIVATRDPDRGSYPVRALRDDMVAPVYEFTAERSDEGAFKDMSFCGRFFERSVKSDTNLTRILRSLQLDSHAFNGPTKRSKGPPKGRLSKNQCWKTI